MGLISQNFRNETRQLLLAAANYISFYQKNDDTIDSPINNSDSDKDKDININFFININERSTVSSFLHDTVTTPHNQSEQHLRAMQKKEGSLYGVILGLTVVIGVFIFLAGHSLLNKLKSKYKLDSDNIENASLEGDVKSVVGSEEDYYENYDEYDFADSDSDGPRKNKFGNLPGRRKTNLLKENQTRNAMTSDLCGCCCGYKPDEIPGQKLHWFPIFIFGFVLFPFSVVANFYNLPNDVLNKNKKRFIIGLLLFLIILIIMIQYFAYMQWFGLDLLPVFRWILCKWFGLENTGENKNVVPSNNQENLSFQKQPENHNFPSFKAWSPPLILLTILMFTLAVSNYYLRFLIKKMRKVESKLPAFVDVVLSVICLPCSNVQLMKEINNEKFDRIQREAYKV